MKKVPDYFYSFAKESFSTEYSESAIVRHYTELGIKTIDSNYLGWLKGAYGRSLNSAYIVNPITKTELKLDRVFSFIDYKTLDGDFIGSWRSPECDIRVDYSVPYFEGSMSNWEDNEFIVPFIGLSADDSAEFDMVCFDYRTDDTPKVVLWWHEDNAQKESVVEPFANSFLEFIEETFTK